ncbi:MAG: HAMP domain-containing histidine kinase [Gemmatimonadaceae bacterium]|nr:HAMP domain-containing histidine kinase [Gemmatimonadaceae bacterium]
MAPGAPTMAADTPQSGEIVRALDALARGISGESCWQDDLIRAGWALGAEEFRLGASLPALLKQLDLMEAMTLYAVETAAARDDTATAADGIAIARRLQRARSLLSLATVKGFVEEYLDGTRARYRSLRHDIRNPLGTIRTAVSLMEDETIPADMRANPRFRAMVKRNATSIDTMVGRRLGDGAAREEAFAWHDVPLADVVRTVRRDLREDAAEAHCGVIIEEPLPTVRTDALGAELLLRMVVAAVLRGAATHSDVTVSLAEQNDRTVVLAVRHEPNGLRSGEREAGLALAERLARKMGARVWEDDLVYIALPVSPADEGENIAGARQGTD